VLIEHNKNALNHQIGSSGGALGWLVSAKDICIILLVDTLESQIWRKDDK